MGEEQLTETEKEQIKEVLGFGAPIPEEKQNVHTFLNKVATADDTTKVGNLTEDELGLPSKTLRTYQEMALIAKNIIGSPEISDYYIAKGEIITATSLSKNAKLINLAVVQKRIVEDETKPTQKKNAGWFKPKNKEENSQHESKY